MFAAAPGARGMTAAPLERLCCRALLTEEWFLTGLCPGLTLWYSPCVK